MSPECLRFEGLLGEFMARFDPVSYQLYRVHYPVELFEPLKPYLGPLSGRSLRLLDLGAGTGMSTWSLFQFFKGFDEAVLVDPDPAMLDRSNALDFGNGVRSERCVASAEAYEPKVKADLVLVGSAWHWMNSDRTVNTVLKSLKPGGWVFVFEYQFPKAVPDDLGRTLNDWVRRAFNLKWKEIGQQPRGSLNEITERFRRHPDFCFAGESACEMSDPLTPEDLTGVIVSQSRFLAYELALSDEEKTRVRSELLEDLKQVWPVVGPMSFTYRFKGYAFRTRSV